MKLIIASNNKHKLVEMKAILAPFFDEIVSIREAGIEHETVEDGSTFMENAIKKAREIAELSDCCAIALAYPDGKTVTAEDYFFGEIAHDEKGENGFGYDPLFYLPEYGCTSAEISPEEKNRISHRGKALMSLVRKLKAL